MGFITTTARKVTDLPHSDASATNQNGDCDRWTEDLENSSYITNISQYVLFIVSFWSAYVGLFGLAFFVRGFFSSCVVGL